MQGHSLARVTSGSLGRNRVSTTHLSPENRILPPLPDSCDQSIQLVLRDDTGREYIAYELAGG